MIVAVALLAFYCIVLFAAAVQDVRTLTISNVTVVALLVASILLVAFVRDTSWWQHLATFAIVLLFGFAFFNFGWMGGGDAKLMASAAALFTLSELAWFAFAVTFSGVVLLIVMVLSGQLKRNASRAAADGRARDRKVLPYGVAIALGATITAYWALHPQLGGL